MGVTHSSSSTIDGVDPKLRVATGLDLLLSVAVLLIANRRVHW